MKNRELDTNNVWEEIVNCNAEMRSFSRERADARNRERRLRKLCLSISAVAALGLTFFILGITGALVEGIAMTTSMVLTMISCYLLGRYMEAEKK